MILALAASLLTLPCANAQPAPGDDAWSAEDCSAFRLKTTGTGARCGYASVPLHHADPQSRRLRLAVLVIPAADMAQRRPDPLFVGQGGPGASAILSFGQLLLDDAAMRPVRNRDIVLWDQRGTYFSQPRLQCRELAALPPNADASAQRNAMHRCGQRLDTESGDLSAFNSLENARDADALRAILGYAEFNFYGVSYGSELGQFLMRERPRHLRSVVLDAVAPLDFDITTDVPAVRRSVLWRYAYSCAASPACDAAYPDLAARYVALIDRLDREPALVTRPSRDRQGVPYTMSGAGFEAALYQLLYMRDAVAFVPFVIDRATHGNYALMLSMTQPLAAAQENVADGMYTAVECAAHGSGPDAAFEPGGPLKRLPDGQPFRALCRDWRIRPLDNALLRPVHSAIPTLLLSGAFDPVTPPAQAERVASTLTHAWHFSFAAGAHGQAFIVPCANRMIQDFLDDPTRPPDGRCAAQAAPRFFVERKPSSLPAPVSGDSAPAAGLPTAGTEAGAAAATAPRAKRHDAWPMHAAQWMLLLSALAVPLALLVPVLREP